MKSKKDAPICIMPTFSFPVASVNDMATRRPVSTRLVREIQAEATNPNLNQCGQLPGCRTCDLLTDPQVQAAAIHEQADRVSARLSLLDK